MKKWMILLIVFVLAGLLVAGWFVMKGFSNAANVRTEANPQKQLTVLPTSIPVTPTPTIVVTKSGNMFVTVVSPANATVVKTDTIVIKGLTLPNVDVGVNDKDVVSDAKGNFSVTMSLDPGTNDISIVATNEQGDFAEQNISITRE